VRGTATDAKRVLTELLRFRDRGVSPALSRETVDEWVTKWLRDHCTDVSARTRVGYEDLFRRYLTPDLRGRKIAALSVSDVQHWVSGLAMSTLSPTTVRSAHAALRACLSDALRLEKVVRNVAKGVVLPKKSFREMRTLTPAEARNFLRGVEDTPYRALFVVWVHTGLRNAELSALRWTDFDGTTLYCRRALIFAGKRLPQAVGPTKTGKPRTIPLSAEVVAVLKQHRREQAEHRMKYRDAYVDQDLIFANLRGGHIDFHNIQRRFFKPLLKRLELPDIRMYDLRHTCATLLFAAGENLKVVQERLGHSTPMLTLTTYTHVLPGQQAQASERLQQVLRIG
jgi:integrase